MKGICKPLKVYPNLKPTVVCPQAHLSVKLQKQVS